MVPVAVTNVVDCNGDGRREVLISSIDASEAETFLLGFPRSLARSGIWPAQLVVSDAHEA